MAALNLEVDETTDAAYVTVSDQAVARTMEVSELISVDLDALGVPVGVEFIGGLRGSGSLVPLFRAFPRLVDRLTSDGLLPTAGRNYLVLHFTQHSLEPFTDSKSAVALKVPRVRGTDAELVS